MKRYEDKLLVDYASLGIWENLQKHINRGLLELSLKNKETE